MAVDTLHSRRGLGTMALVAFTVMVYEVAVTRLWSVAALVATVVYVGLTDESRCGL